MNQISHTVRLNPLRLSFKQQPHNPGHINFFEGFLVNHAGFDILRHHGNGYHIGLVFFNNVLIQAECRFKGAVRSQRMPVFMPDNKNMFGLGIIITMKFFLKQSLKHAFGALFVAGHSNLSVINIAPSAACLDREFVIIGQVLSGCNSAAALGIIPLKCGQININHGLFDLIAIVDFLFVSVG